MEPALGQRDIPNKTKNIWEKYELWKLSVDWQDSTNPNALENGRFTMTSENKGSVSVFNILTVFLKDAWNGLSWSYPDP